MSVSSATQTCEWIGASGCRYTYYVYPLPASFDEGQLGNYVYAKMNSTGQWVPVYIGQGDLHDRANHHHKADCIRRKAATHFHAHKNSVELDRLAEESDLLANYPNSYDPTGCNERRGG